MGNTVARLQRNRTAVVACPVSEAVPHPDAGQRMEQQPAQQIVSELTICVGPGNAAFS